MVIDTEKVRLYRGIITEVTDVSVSIDLNGRMGMLRFPLRMLVSDKKPTVGQEIAIYLGYPEII